MKLTQNWVGYLTRSYEQIKSSLIKKLVSNNPEITDHSESNLLIVMVDMFAGVGEMLNYYIDVMGREAYLGTAQKYTSVVRIVKLMDYRIKARAYPTADLLFSTTVGDELAPTTSPIVIPKGTTILDVNGLTFRTMVEKTIPVGQSGIYVPAAQYNQVTSVNLGTSNGQANQKFLLPQDYVHNSLRVTLDGIIWRDFTSFGQMIATTQGFIVDIEENGAAYVYFGDGVNGAIPGTGLIVYGDYEITEGARANNPPNTITNISSPVTIPTGFTLEVTNPDYAVGGTYFESMEDIRNRAPRSLRTVDRAVTYQDYIDIATLHPSVGAAEVQYCCGKYVDVYIVPNSKGTSTLSLIDSVQNKLNCAKMITTQVKVRASGISKIWLQATIVGKPLYESDDILIAVINALDAEYGFSKISINRKVAVSDITATIENIPLVERVDIQAVRVLPFPRPIEATNSILNIDFLSVPVASVRTRYTLIYKAISDSFQVLKETFIVADLGMGIAFNDGIVNFRVNSGSYINGEKWEFVVTPSFPQIFPQGLINVDDYTAPIIDIAPLIEEDVPRQIFSQLTVVTTGVTTACNPPC